MRSILLLVIAVAAMAADVPAPPEARPTAPTASLGVAIDPAATTFVGEGLVVLRVESGSAAAAMDLAAGDTLVGIDGKPLRQEADLVRELAARRPGDRVELAVVLADGSRAVRSGPLQAATPRGAGLARQLDELQGRLAELEGKTREPTLAEIVERLRDLERDLPRAAAAFKEVYPEGVFRVAVSIDISSHAAAADPVAIDIGTMPAPGAPADQGRR